MNVRTTVTNLLAFAILGQLHAAAPPKTPAPALTRNHSPRQTAPPDSRAPRKKQAGKAAKNAYTGPTTLVVLPATPMLDGEGKQRVDPDGNLMFNPPVKQIRDKKGHPVFDANGKPVFQTATNLGYDEKGKKILVRRRSSRPK